MEKPLEIAWVDLKVGCGEVSGNYQDWTNSASQVDGYSDGTCLPALWVEGSKKEQWLLPAFLYWRKMPLQLFTCHQTIQLCLICPWCLTSCCPSVRSQRVSLCLGLLRGTLEALCLTHPQSTLIFKARSSWEWNPGLEGQVGAETHYSSAG